MVKKNEESQYTFYIILIKVSVDGELSVSHNTTKVSVMLITHLRMVRMVRMVHSKVFDTVTHLCGEKNIKWCTS